MSISQVDGSISWTPEMPVPSTTVTITVTDRDGSEGSSTTTVSAITGIGDGGIIKPTISPSAAGSTTTIDYLYGQQVRLSFFTGAQAVSSGSCKINWAIYVSPTSAPDFVLLDQGGSTFAGCTVTKPRSPSFFKDVSGGVVGQRFRIIITREDSNSAGPAAANVGTSSGTW